MSEQGAPYRDVFVTASDGLKLHARDYGDRHTDVLPVVCLPGLTRSARDFHDLAMTLARDKKKPRRVVVVEYRGRGQSGYDRHWGNYNVLKELQDLNALLTAMNIEHAAFIGTSRGGLLLMLLASVRPGAIAKAVLNDVGPVIDIQGLMRIKRMLADLKAPGSWEDAISTTRKFNESAFPRFGDVEWEKMARQSYRDENGKPAIDFDQALSKTLDAFDADTLIPTLWPQYKALSAMPTLVIRGELSGLLTPETLARMEETHPRMEIFVAECEGHAPMLWDAESQKRIATFIQA